MWKFFVLSEKHFICELTIGNLHLAVPNDNSKACILAYLLFYLIGFVSTSPRLLVSSLLVEGNCLSVRISCRRATTTATASSQINSADETRQKSSRSESERERCEEKTVRRSWRNLCVIFRAERSPPRVRSVVRFRSLYDRAELCFSSQNLKCRGVAV